MIISYLSNLIAGFERLLPPGASPLDSPHWLELQRRYGHPLVPGAAGGSHIPGIYPPTSIASDLMARERDRLERLGMFIFILKIMDLKLVLDELIFSTG